jgi:hypothetical protein
MYSCAGKKEKKKEKKKILFFFFLSAPERLFGAEGTATVPKNFSEVFGTVVGALRPNQSGGGIISLYFLAKR